MVMASLYWFSFLCWNLPQVRMLSFLRSPVILQMLCTQYTHWEQVLYSLMAGFLPCRGLGARRLAKFPVSLFRQMKDPHLVDILFLRPFK